MPELPEVENLRRGLEARVAGQTIRKVTVAKPKLVSAKGNGRTASPAKVREFIRGLTGEKIIAVDRRAKNLLFRTARGKILLVHLKMTGQFVYKEKEKVLIDGGHPIQIQYEANKPGSEISGSAARKAPKVQPRALLPGKHTHIVFELSRGTLYYNDTRMFGYLLYYPSAAEFEKENHFGGLGLEPLDPGFTLEYFRTAIKKRKGRLKTVLMDQRVVTGLGNIYADEVAFEAQVKPTRSAASLKPAEIGKIYAAIKRIIPLAIRLGGSSVATYRLLDDSRGNYAREHKVYGKTGGQCPRCGARLKTIQVNNRTTVYCPQCQK